MGKGCAKLPIINDRTFLNFNTFNYIVHSSELTSIQGVSRNMTVARRLVSRI